ncbi:Ribokinase-like protein [Sistotremastrum niveocremeum HHB9708]|uniref:ATP-dependent (S)-NAD(P)H-hydrate dehydratase n=1 Tax=Sistotremastrum niveocremeum HHB9708 TaxID=1314777 RepID=A0A164W4X4_9AGAM|nr:Ribokinase-like protein [Sistotremastrum niveocremeum HHB9708]
MTVSKKIFEQIKLLIPPLNGTLHKGQAGRVAVLGGALDYTGAPFFASISALRTGADLSHVICSPTAGGAIKSYSPDLIVHPILREEIHPPDLESTIDGLLSRLHVLIIGPGLGREDYMQAFARLTLSLAKKQDMYVVLDADALWMVQKDPETIKGYPKAVLTPNLVEFKRLCEALDIDPKSDPKTIASRVSLALGGVTILQKGASDIISVKTPDSASEHQDETVEVDVPGGLKRCGGQGDILSGIVGTFLAWGKNYENGVYGEPKFGSTRIPILSAVAGCLVMRTTSRRAFEKEGRGVVTQDMLPEIGVAFSEVFGAGSFGGEKEQKARS